jgi:hypothetical protein
MKLTSLGFFSKFFQLTGVLRYLIYFGFLNIFNLTVEVLVICNLCLFNSQLSKGFLIQNKLVIV